LNKDIESEKINQLLDVFQERIRRPDVIHFNQLYEENKARHKTTLEEDIEYMANFGYDPEMLKKDFDSREKRFEPFKNLEIEPEPKSLMSSEEDFKNIRYFLKMHGHEFKTKQIHELQPLYMEVLTSQKLKKEKLTMDIDQLKDARDTMRAWPEAQHIRVHAEDWGPGWIKGNQEEGKLHWTDVFIPSSGSSNIMVIWGAKGWYQVYSDDGPFISSKSSASIKLSLDTLQFWGYTIMHSHYEKNIFSLEGQNINKSGWIDNPISFVDFRISTQPDVLMLTGINMTFSCYARSAYAETTLDFLNPRWVNFNAYIVD
jgi:hypothetical protein